MTEQDVRILVSALVPAVQEAVVRMLANERTAGALEIAKAIGPIAERMAALEARTPAAGPPGADGAPGPAGPAGADGKPGLVYCGVHVDGRTYGRGECVTSAGSLWHCNAESTTTKPGNGSRDWTLTVKCGRDG